VPESGNEPRRDQRRVGPWLRRYSHQPQRTWRDRVPELLLGAGATVAFAVVLLGLGWLFLRYPLWVLGGLIAVWALGFLTMVVKRRQLDAREAELRRRQDEPRP
jgi:hypothetical protein